MIAQSVVEPTKWLGETIGFWVQNSILLASAIVAICTIRASARQERRRATIDVVIEQRRDERLIAARQIITKKHEAGETNLAKYLETKDSEDFKVILLVLNAYEFVASGIREDAFDEDTFKRLRCSTVLKDWEALWGFVMEFRRQKKIPTLFQDFEWLYDKWKIDPLPANKRKNH